MTNYRFAFRSSFAGTVDYDVFDGRQSIGKVSVTVSPVSDYWRQWSRNPAQEDSSIGILRWHGLLPGSDLSCLPGMVDAFNAWKAAEYADAKATYSARYPDDWEKYFPAPESPVTAGRFNAATGLWERLDALALAA